METLTIVMAALYCTGTVIAVYIVYNAVATCSELVKYCLKVVLSTTVLKAQDSMQSRLLSKGLGESFAMPEVPETRPPNRDDVADQMEELARRATGAPPNTMVIREQPE